MNTILYIKEILHHYQNSVRGIVSEEARSIVDAEFLANIKKVANKFPVELISLCDKYINTTDAIDYVENIEQYASQNYVPLLTNHTKFTDVIEGKIIETPGFKDSYDVNEDLNSFLLKAILSLPIGKIRITFIDLDNNLGCDWFEKNINAKIYNEGVIINVSTLEKYLEHMSNQIEQIRHQYYNYPEFCKKNKNIPEPYELIVIRPDANSQALDIINSDKFSTIRLHGESAGVYVVKITEKQSDVKDKVVPRKLSVDELSYEDVKTNIKQKRKQCTFSTFSLYEFQCSKNNLDDLKQPLYEHINCAKEIISLNTFCKKLSRPTPSTFLTVKYQSEVEEYINKIQSWRAIDWDFADKFEFSVDHTFVENAIYNKYPKLLECRPISENKNLLNACVKYINKEIERPKKRAVLKQDFSNIANNVYESNTDAIILPVGKANNTDMYFRMDTVNHVHSFIVGSSGSGKSVFLHNIINSAILKYAPEDLQLYLLDFKIGGVEFNRYRGVKHIKALLVDNSDQQITLEILKELHNTMVERGKKLRDCGINNIIEYNKMFPTAKMSQILVIVDECHEMFRERDDIPRIITSDISEIVTKIAKEGRSQGVHLVMATQTLAGAVINKEILNNISDHYILKCAANDSENLVEKSSDITSKLLTGEIYYHHAESACKFDAYYTDKENATLTIDIAKEKAIKHNSNGEFYFNGAQLFKFNNNVISQNIQCIKYPTTYLGKSISINQSDVKIELRKDYSENIIVFGLNDFEQATRTTMNIFTSLLAMSSTYGLKYKFKVINCLNHDESIYNRLLRHMENLGLCEVIETRHDRTEFIRTLAEGIINNSVDNTIVLILGQDRFRELKLDLELNAEKEEKSINSDDPFGFGNLSFGHGNSQSDVRTFRQAMDIILDKGPELGVHTIIQVDKLSNFLFSEFISPKFVFQKIKHLIMLRSGDDFINKYLDDNIHLESLSKDMERLRAYYYSEESNSYTLFTPYQDMEISDINTLFNKY